MINYENFADVMKAAGEVANQFQKNNNQAITECNIQGLKFVGISKDNKRFNAKFLLKNEEYKIQIWNKKTGVLIRLYIRDETIPRI